MTAPDAARRMFFALWPDRDVRRQLAAVARENCERPVPAANLHMTLAFLGRVREQQQACLCHTAARVRSAPFELHLQRLEFWRRGGIQWLGSGLQSPAVLRGLVASLRQVLARCGVETQDTEFVPHVTLSRKAEKPPSGASVNMIRWAVKDFVLAESIPVDGGVIYRIVQRWPLG